MRKLLELAEAAAYGRPPLDAEVCTSLNPVFMHVSQLPGAQQERARGVLAKAAAFYVGGEAFRDQAALDTLAVLKKSLPPRAFVPTQLREEGWKEKPIAVDVMTQRFPEFVIDPVPIKSVTKTVRGALCFSRLGHRDSKPLIVFDFGRTPNPIGFSCVVGVSDPLFLMDIGAPWATGNYWPFHSPQSFREAMGKALDVVDVLLPEFERRMAEA